VLEFFAVLSLIIATASALFLVTLVARRVLLERHERLRAERVLSLRPVALALLAGDQAEVPALPGGDERVFAALLGRYGRAVRGAPRERIAAYFESTGAVDRELGRLESTRDWRRASAAFTLGDMGSSRAVPAHVRALGDREPEVRVAAARSLGRLAAVEAVRPLAETLVAGSLPRTLSGQALLEIGPAGLPSLVGLFAHEEPEVRAGAVELVGLLGSATEAAPVLARLRDASAAVRAAAAGALGRLGAADAADALRGALDDRVPFVRAAAATALGRIRYPAAIPELLELAGSEEFEAANAAAHALAQMDPALVVRLGAQPGGSQHLQEAADLVALR
jgi:hypothetical protein